VSKVAASRQPFIASDLQQIDDLRARDSIHVSKILSAVCLPLIDGDRLIGVIYADSRFVTPQFTDADRRVLDIVAVQATVAVENARRAGELKIRSDRLAEQNLVLSRKLAREFAMQGMVARSRAMLEVFETVEKIAHSDVSVLILGESGTGKELLARAIHDKSLRREGPFQAVNCAGIPVTLAQSILFGYRKGAYTSGDHEKPGIFEIANRGTLFLDEVGDLPDPVQPSFLRVLQEKEVSRIGEEEKLRSVDVRIISATNLDLARAVEDGEFRQDLFFRLNKIVINLPPLRARPEDIVPLAEYFLDKCAKEQKQARATLSPDARALLMNHRWPGNVRELESAIEGGIIFQDDDGLIHAKTLERFLQGRDRDAGVDAVTPGTLRELIDRREEEIIRRVIAENDNNRTNAAKALGLSRQQLYQKIRKYRISSSDD
jgi:Nif-specific regulatory protein